MEQIVNALRTLMCIPIKLYQYMISPMLPRCCRFEPTCSEYALQALKQCGLYKGLWLTCRRLLRCHPWGGQGYDPLSFNKEKS